MKKGRKRTMSICIDDLLAIPEDKITIAGNKKKYVSLTTYDYNDEQLQRTDHDFSISLTRTEQERIAKVPIHWIGGGLIHENT